MNCQYCYEDLVPENTLYLLPHTLNPYSICKDCVLYQKNNQVNQFVSQLRKEDCLATIRRMLNSGIPLKFDKEIDTCFYTSNNDKIENTYFSGEDLIKIKEINITFSQLLNNFKDETISQEINEVLDQFFQVP